MSSVPGAGRLANLIFQNFVVSQIADKHKLRVISYKCADKIASLGIRLYTDGTVEYPITRLIRNEDVYDSLDAEDISYNVCSDDFFQTRDISKMLYDHLRTESQKQSIIDANPYKPRYGQNNDIFVHIRLGDARRYSPGYQYYQSSIQYIIQRYGSNKIYVASDVLNDPMIRELRRAFGGVQLLVALNEIETIQFGSTCRHLVLSHGSYSAVIGYLAFNAETVVYSSFDGLERWHGDIFSIPGWSMYKPSKKMNVKMCF
jgi:hypothetical protein